MEERKIDNWLETGFAIPCSLDFAVDRRSKRAQRNRGGLISGGTARMLTPNLKGGDAPSMADHDFGQYQLQERV